MGNYKRRERIKYWYNTWYINRYSDTNRPVGMMIKIHTIMMVIDIFIIITVYIIIADEKE